MQENEVRLPNSQNVLLILFNDKLSNIQITHTLLLWEMLKDLTDKTFRFTKEGEGYKLTIDVSMEKINA